MIGIISFVLCLVAFLLTIVKVYAFEFNGKKHDAFTWFCFLLVMTIFAVVSYL